MKLEVEYPTRGSRRFYRETKWELDGDTLIQLVPAKAIEGSLEPSFLPGDNIRLDGDIHHIVSRQSRMIEDSKRTVYGFFYKIEKGRYKPPEWLEIGAV